MTGSKPISFNAGAESRDWVSANTSCWFALRRRTSARPIAPLAPAIRILIARTLEDFRRWGRAIRRADCVLGDEIRVWPWRFLRSSAEYATWLHEWKIPPGAGSRQENKQLAP